MMYVYYDPATGRIVADAIAPLPIGRDLPCLQLDEYIPFVGTTHYVLAGVLTPQPDPIQRPEIPGAMQ